MTKEEEFNLIANATKDTGMTYKGCKIYTNPYIEPGIIYFINDEMTYRTSTHEEKISLVERIRAFIKSLL